jgi:hypothetical protein
VKAQAARFARLFVVALVGQQAAQPGLHLTRTVIVAALVGAAETAWRQFKAPPDAPAYTPKHGD